MDESSGIWNVKCQAIPMLVEMRHLFKCKLVPYSCYELVGWTLFYGQDLTEVCPGILVGKKRKHSSYARWMDGYLSPTELYIPVVLLSSFHSGGERRKIVLLRIETANFTPFDNPHHQPKAVRSAHKLSPFISSVLPSYLRTYHHSFFFSQNFIEFPLKRCAPLRVGYASTLNHDGQPFIITPL